MDHDGRDRIGEQHEHFDGDEDEQGSGSVVLQAAGAPEALALASLVLAVVSLVGLGLLNGSPYLPQAFSAGEPLQRTLVTAALLGAALALLPLALGAVALRRLPDDSGWRPFAGAGVLVAGVSVLLRLAIAARTATDDAVQFMQF